jgi:hypothetical protein
MTTIRLRQDGESWTVVVCDAIEFGGFSSEESAGRWVIEYMRSLGAAADEKERKMQIAAAILLEPTRPQ